MRVSFRENQISGGRVPTEPMCVSKEKVRKASNSTSCDGSQALIYRKAKKSKLSGLAVRAGHVVP